MADLKARVELGPNGKTAKLIFANLKESEIYETQNDFFSQLPSMVNEGKISKEEVPGITLEILEAKDFPIDESGEVLGSDEFFDALAEILAELNVMSVFEKVAGLNIRDHNYVLKTFPEINNPEWKMEQPIFRMCDCGKKHAYILFSVEDRRSYSCQGKNSKIKSICASPKFVSKKEGMVHIDGYIKHISKLSPEVEAILRQAVNDSILPDVDRVEE